MHDTAFHIGSLAMNIYADLRTDSILEVGAQSVNGSLRDNALPTTRYVGLDIEEGEGVDIVIEPSAPFPVEDDTFDLVMASSVFEHDSFFWMTFLEMCRATKEGGYIYINAPSNGTVHRYPQDNWRFYPDSGRALAKWAVSQGTSVTLVESFIAKRETDIWNDFVAIFRKGRITKSLPKVFIHEHVSCTDVITWKSKDIANPSEQTEDALLMNQAGERAQQAEDALAQVVHQHATLEQEAVTLKTQLAAAEDERQRKVSEVDEIRGELNLRQSELRQRQEEIEQTRAELSHARSELEQARGDVFRVQARINQLSSELFELQKESELRTAELAAQKAEVAKYKSSSQLLTQQLTVAENDLKSAKERASRSDRRIDELVAALSVAQSASTELERKLSAHFHETATLSKVILDSQQSTAHEAEKARKIRELFDALVTQPSWWAILPRARRSRLQTARLSRLGLFDAQSYLGKNPDVAEAGEDPLHHYVHHGIDEQRPI